MQDRPPARRVGPSFLSVEHGIIVDNMWIVSPSAISLSGELYILSRPVPAGSIRAVINDRILWTFYYSYPARLERWRSPVSLPPRFFASRVKPIFPPPLIVS